jgi:AraC family transcriptional regulator
MLPEIKHIAPIKLVGLRLITSLAENKTFELWRGLMSRRREIGATLGNRLFSVEIYESETAFEDFTPQTIFEKWAAVEVEDFRDVPEGMETHVLTGGTYAVFVHRGPTGEYLTRTAPYIFGTWLPASGYRLDAREHFEIMDERYLGPENPASEEEIWIPVF